MVEIVVASMLKGIIGEIKECSRSMQEDDGCKVVVHSKPRGRRVSYSAQRICPQLAQVPYVGEATDDAQSMPSGRPMHDHKHGRNVK